MANLLQTNASPTTPNPNPLQTQSAQPMAAQPGGASPLQTAQPQQPPPPPSHQQTVAAIRHFVAIEHEITTLLQDPDCGKANLRSKIIDGASSLVAQRIITPANAVTQLGNVPDRPFDQRKWLESQLAQTVQAGAAILDHHRAAFAGGPAPGSDQPSDPDNHIATVSGLAAQYQGAPGNA